jgi:hypothetical protein
MLSDNCRVADPAMSITISGENMFFQLDMMNERLPKCDGRHNKKFMSGGYVSAQAYQSYSEMSLTKIPFILLATWGFNTSITPPNPPPPKNERISSGVPMENTRFTQWGTFIFRVSNHLQGIQKNSSNNSRPGPTIGCCHC